MWQRLLMAAVVLASGVAGSASAQELNVGDPAPKLAVKEFVKGEPIAGLDKGKLYVVEFWATWCGPCRQTIPHLTELQKKYPAITFLGITKLAVIRRLLRLFDSSNRT